MSDTKGHMEQKNYMKGKFFAELDVQKRVDPNALFPLYNQTITLKQRGEYCTVELRFSTNIRKKDDKGVWKEFLVIEKYIAREKDIIGKVHPVKWIHEQTERFLTEVYRHILYVNVNTNDSGIFRECENQESEEERMKPKWL